MKKLLALVLALVMSMSLVTISNADFKDADKIDYTEAVDVMNAVGVLIGDENGNFNPKDNLTRAQAAKIISYLLLGNKTAEGLAGSGKFTDVAKTSWAAGFVDYCAAVGVVNGVGNGKFDPNGSLTTLQFAKMLLVALGYDAKIEGFVGTDWSINVSAKANQVGLLNGLDVSANATLTREQAAKMALNTLKAPLVEYENKGGNISVNGADINIGASKAEFKTSTNKKAQTIDNSMINGTTAYTVEFAEEYYSDLRLTKTTDDFGRDANQWKYKTVEIGTYADDSDLKETYTAKAKRGDLYNLVGSTVVDGIKLGKYNFELYVDGKKVANPNPDNYFVKNSSSATGTTYADGLSGNGVLTEVYMDNDNNVKIVVVYTYLVQATADYNSIKGILSIEYKDVNAADNNDPTLPVTIENDDVNVEGFKADDYILVTYSRSAREVKSAVKAEIVTGEVSEYTEDDYVIVGGTKYSYSKVVGNGADESKTQYTIKEKATVVLDQYGYIICVDDALASSSYVFIKETAKSNGVGNRVAADAYFTDGTNETIIIKKADGKTDANTKLLADGRSAANTSDGQGKWYTFSKDSNGEYTLNALKSTVTRAVGTVTYAAAIPGVGGASGTPAKDEVIKNDKINFMPNADGTYTVSGTSKNVNAVKGNSSTVFVVLEADGTVTTATGIKNAPSVSTGPAVLAGSPTPPNATIVASVKNNGAYAEYVFVDLSKDSAATVDGSENAADYMLLLKYTGNKTTDSENNTYYKYKVLFDGQETEKYIESSLTGSDANGMLLRNIKENSKGFVTGATQFDNSAKRVNIALGTAPNNTVSIDKETISIGGQDFYAEKANVTLLINKGANNDLIDQGKDYQLYQTSAKAAAALLKGYTLTGASKAYVLRDDDNSDIAKSIYIFVDGANSPTGLTPTSGSYSASAYKVGSDICIKLDYSTASGMATTATYDVAAVNTNSGYVVNDTDNSVTLTWANDGSGKTATFKVVANSNNAMAYTITVKVGTDELTISNYLGG